MHAGVRSGGRCGRSGRDALVLLLVGAGASGFAGLLRMYRLHEQVVAQIPVQRRPEPVQTAQRQES